MTTVLELDRTHVEAFLDFASQLPEGDRTFIREPITSRDQVLSWTEDDAHGNRWVALDGGSVVGMLAVLPLTGWSDHVGEIRLVVHPAYRGRGLGRELARMALVHAAQVGLAKLVVEIVADHESQLAMFTAMGFTGEALLCDHIRDRNGQLRDLVMLAHYLDATWSGMETVGLEDELLPVGD